MTTLHNGARCLLNKVTANRKFARDSIILISGTFLAQLINVMSAPILTRLYSPSEFGILGLFVTITGIIVPIATLRYESAIMLPEEKEEAIHLFWLCIIISIIMASISFVVVIYLRDPIASLLRAESLAPWLLSVPFFFLIYGWINALQILLSREKLFKELSFAKICQSATCATVQITTNFFHIIQNVGLLIGYVISIFSQALLLMSNFWKPEINKIKIPLFNAGMIKNVAKKYYKFPLYAAPQSLINFAATQGMNLIIAVLFTPYVVGQYFLAVKMLSLPTSLVAQSISPAFYQRMVSLRDDSEAATNFIIKFISNLFFIIIPPMILLYFLTPLLFKICFGSHWIEAGKYAQALIPYYVFSFVGFSVGQVFFIYEKQEYGVFYNIVDIILKIFALLAGAKFGGIIFSLFLYGIAGSIMYSVVLILAIRWAGCKWGDMPSKIVLVSVRSIKEELMMIKNSVLKNH